MIFKLSITMLTEPVKHLTATSMHLQVHEYTVWIHAWSVSTPSSDKLGIGAKHAVLRSILSLIQPGRKSVSYSVIQSALALRFLLTAAEHGPEVRSTITEAASILRHSRPTSSVSQQSSVAAR